MSATRDLCGADPLMQWRTMAAAGSGYRAGYDVSRVLQEMGLADMIFPFRKF